MFASYTRSSIKEARRNAVRLFSFFLLYFFSLPRAAFSSGNLWEMNPSGLLDIHSNTNGIRDASQAAAAAAATATASEKNNKDGNPTVCLVGFTASPRDVMFIYYYMDVGRVSTYVISTI
ncbi:hypothetical protein F4814DRAFT_436010 [Daldinia grandis]|nr:hypothetical protein F4814DRAFT_436010 [Daldinia grandis]